MAIVLRRTSTMFDGEKDTEVTEDISISPNGKRRVGGCGKFAYPHRNKPLRFLANEKVVEEPTTYGKVGVRYNDEWLQPGQKIEFSPGETLEIVFGGWLPDYTITYVQ